MLKTDVLFRRKLGKNQIKKKWSLPKTEVFLLLNHCSRGIWCCIRSDIIGLIPLIIQRSNLDGGDAQALWGDASPYNLSTAYKTLYTVYSL